MSDEQSSNEEPSVSAPPQERRGSRRRVTSAELRLKIADGEVVSARMIDVSATGVQVELEGTDGSPNTGEHLVLELVEAGVRAAPPRPGEVVWSGDADSPRLGIRFVSQDGADDASGGAADPEIDIARVRVDPQVALRFPAERARRWGVLPFAMAEDEVLVAAAEEPEPRAMSALERCFRREVRLHAAATEALIATIARVYSGAESLALDRGSVSVDAVSIDEDAPDAIALYDHLFASAIMLGASDLHIDTFEQETRIRARIDGELETVRTLALDAGATLINRIKVMAGLDIAERRAPQDGRLRHEADGGVKVDVRVASLPAKHGERLTLRLLAQNAGQITLASLGMSEDQLRQFAHAIRQPHGMVLITGPTGSGKSTTLYAAIQQLIAESDLNVITIEDPVEYQINGVTQVEVSQSEKITFAKALRSTLRHDPDVVMVGEIRDAETADIAVKAALTGHLVFSTLHTNDAAGAITRLQDMGVAPYLVSATLRLVAAQRLVRRLCPKCAKPVDCSVEHAAAIGCPDLAGDAIREPSPEGCVYCGGRGYAGRLALFEMVTCDRELSRLIVDGASEERVLGYLQSKGVATLGHDAALKLRDGRTSMAEALRSVVSFGDTDFRTATKTSEVSAVSDPHDQPGERD
ncbi:MAG: ATPase, T2SS/T4P/T4SS family [Planctomycetota bacterium]